MAGNQVSSYQGVSATSVGNKLWCQARLDKFAKVYQVQGDDDCDSGDEISNLENVAPWLQKMWHNNQADSNYLEHVVGDIDLGKLFANCHHIHTTTNPATSVVDMPMSNHQQRAFQWMMNMELTVAGGGIIGHDSGVDVFPQVVNLIANHRPGPDNVYKVTAVVVSPHDIVPWSQQLRDCLEPGQKVGVYYGKEKVLWKHYDAMSKVDVMLTSYRMLSDDYKKGEQSVWFGPNKGFFRVILVDGEHIKNLKTGQSQAAAALPARHRFCLMTEPELDSMMGLIPYFRFIDVAPYNNRTTFEVDVTVPWSTTKKSLDYRRRKSLQRLEVYLSVVYHYQPHDSVTFDQVTGVEEPIEGEPMGFDIIDEEPGVEEPRVEEHIEAEPIEAEPVEAEPIEGEPMDIDIIDEEPGVEEPIEAESIEAEPIEAEPMDIDIIDEEPINIESDDGTLDNEPIHVESDDDTLSDESIFDSEDVGANDTLFDEPTKTTSADTVIDVDNDTPTGEPLKAQADDYDPNGNFDHVLNGDAADEPITTETNEISSDELTTESKDNVVNDEEEFEDKADDDMVTPTEPTVNIAKDNVVDDINININITVHVIPSVPSTAVTVSSTGDTQKASVDDNEQSANTTVGGDDDNNDYDNDNEPSNTNTEVDGDDNDNNDNVSTDDIPTSMIDDYDLQGINVNDNDLTSETTSNEHALAFVTPTSKAADDIAACIPGAFIYSLIPSSSSEMDDLIVSEADDVDIADDDISNEMLSDYFMAMTLNLFLFSILL